LIAGKLLRRIAYYASVARPRRTHAYAAAAL